MARTGRLYRWIAVAGGSGILLQTVTTCDPTNPLVQEQWRNQIFLPWFASILTDTIFYFLDNALVHLTS